MAKYDTVWRNLSICFETSNTSMVTCYLQDLTSPWIHIWYLMHFRNVCVEYMGFRIFKDVFQIIFMGSGFTSEGSAFSVVVCKIQASKRYIESLPLVLKDKKSCFSQGERFAVQLPLDCSFAPTAIGCTWKPSTAHYIYYLATFISSQCCFS